MDRPLQAILISGEKKRDDIIQGHKATTVKLGHIDYKPGIAIVGCHILGWCISIKITVVEHYLLKDLPLRLLQKNGYKNLEDAIQSLKIINPSTEPMSTITWVEWERTANH